MSGVFLYHCPHYFLRWPSTESKLTNWPDSWVANPNLPSLPSLHIPSVRITDVHLKENG